LRVLFAARVVKKPLSGIAREGVAMGEIYTIVITAILLFPWSLVGVILGGAAVTKVKRAVQGRRRDAESGVRGVVGVTAVR
jgi:hypothetical protein